VTTTDLAIAARAIAAELPEGLRVNPVAMAEAIAYGVAIASKPQAEALAAWLWPGWRLDTLRGLLGAGRTGAIAAAYREPKPGKQGYADLGRQLGIAPKNARKRVQSGIVYLVAYQAQRATH